MRPGVKIALWLHDGHTGIGIRGYCMHIVAPGNSFITARGNIKPGEEIKEGDFADKETFIKYVSQKRIVAGKSNAQQAKEAAEKAAAAKTARENADKQKRDAKAKAAGQLEVAQIALKKAQEAQSTAKDTANKIANDLAASRQAQVEKLDNKIVDHEKAVRDAETAAGKAKPEQKEEAEKNLLAAMENVEAARKEMAELITATYETPELAAALGALEKANDALIEAEANVAEAEQAVKKAS